MYKSLLCPYMKYGEVQNVFFECSHMKIKITEG